MKNIFDNGTLKIFLLKRIDATGVSDFEKELYAAENLDAAKEILLDAENLNYISSMGIRVFLKFRKKYKNTSIILINASDEVYKVFEMTGFTEFIKVLRKIRKIEIGKMKLLGGGMYGLVYRVNEEQILKLFFYVHSSFEMQKIVKTIRTVFTHGIPTVLPFEVVETEKGFGVILEMLDSEILSTLMHGNSKDFDNYTCKMVELAKLLAATEFEEDTLKKTNDLMKNKVTSAEKFLTEEEFSTLKNYVDLVPQRNSGVHGDFHAQNIMTMKGNLMLIDMDDFSCGHPIWDLAQTYTHYQMMPNIDDDIDNIFSNAKDRGISREEDFFRFNGLTYAEIDRLWKNFFNNYFEGYSSEDTTEFLTLIKFYSRFMLIIIAINICNRCNNDTKRFSLLVEIIRSFMKEMSTFDIVKFKQTFDKWK